ncbi:kinase [Luteibacter sp. PPL552]
MEAHDASTLVEAVFGRIVAGDAPSGRAVVLGLSGLQGSGKSTLAAGLAAHAQRLGWNALAISLDDFYLTRTEREALARDVHPLLITRGVPGTHDLARLIGTLDALEHAGTDRPVRVPRFDKGVDDRAPTDRWSVVIHPPRLVILEGWCLGLAPQDDAALHTAVNALERDEDADGRWRRWVNERLADYAAVWRRLDALVVLRAPSWEIIPRWRDDAERPLRQRGEPRAMDHAALSRFLQHYERWSRHALATLGPHADLVVDLDAERGVTALSGDRR